MIADAPATGSANGHAIYTGWVRHRRYTPAEHAFRYPVYQLMLDLDRLDSAFRGRWFWSTRRPALARFRRDDHFGDPARPLAECVRDLVAERLGRRPDGPVRLLTNLRCFGFIINPVSFFYCHSAGDDGPGPLEAIIAEVHNTPWNERHCYVLDARAAARPARAGGGDRSPRSSLAFEFDKDFHVSPFHPMDQRYAWRFTVPGDRLLVHMENHDERGLVTDATSVMRRRPITGPRLAATLARHPFMTGRVAVAIYWQALRLRLKGAVFHDHPRSTAEVSA